MKLISYSLWGSKPLYLHGALVNAKQVREHFPEWHMRIYHDDTVPSDVLEQLRQFGHVKLVQVNDGSYGMFWRFRALFEPNLDAVLIRDLDSRITWRDVKCVSEWLESPYRLSVIRDHEEHYKVPILGGLFGLKGGPLPNSLLFSMSQYSQVHRYNVDQIWLAHHVWPLMESNRLEHGYKEIQWMAESRTDDEHMCRGYTVDEKPRMDHGAE
jgi:hypothetical protein